MKYKMLDMFLEFCNKFYNTEELPSWTIVLIIICFGGFGLVFCYITHFINKGNMIEYGYVGVNKKKIYRACKEYSLVEKALLLKLYKNAPRKGAYLVLCWILNFIACLGAASEIMSIIYGIATCCKGWSILFMILSGWGVMFGTTAITFIPSIVCLPSERERYRLK